MLLAVRTSSYGCSWEAWRALKKLELLSTAPRATLTLLSCFPSFTRASITRCIRTLKHEAIVKYIRTMERCWLRVYIQVMLLCNSICSNYRNPSSSSAITATKPRSFRFLDFCFTCQTRKTMTLNRTTITLVNGITPTGQ